MFLQTNRRTFSMIAVMMVALALVFGSIVMAQDPTPLQETPTVAPDTATPVEETVTFTATVIEQPSFRTETPIPFEEPADMDTATPVPASDSSTPMTETPTPFPDTPTPINPPPVVGDTGRTLVVTGSGSASGAPDRANIEIGVEITSDTVTDAFAEANSTIDDIINALVDLGIARADIQTTGLNIYTQQQLMGPDATEPSTQYNVSNRVRVLVRDISQVEDVINASVENGANNIFGLNFTLSDPTELMRQARTGAVANAQANAQHLAELLGVSLGSVIKVTEFQGAGIGPVPEAAGNMMADSARIESGQLSISLQVELTYSIISD